MFILPDAYLHITENCNKLRKYALGLASKNVIFTGFLPYQDYIYLMYSVDAVVVLTTRDYIILCGCYEAISTEKSLITSDKRFLRNYFTKAEFVENNSEEIVKKTKNLLVNLDEYHNRKK